MEQGLTVLSEWLCFDRVNSRASKGVELGLAHLLLRFVLVIVFFHILSDHWMGKWNGKRKGVRFVENCESWVYDIHILPMSSSFFTCLCIVNYAFCLGVMRWENFSLMRHLPYVEPIASEDMKKVLLVQAGPMRLAVENFLFRLRMFIFGAMQSSP
ncbi:hypothetical protein Nepgr_001898 [Nepenthes gracilis]|uniref:Uncharacterized protein n=1 Tax=Nepenthes gracilis TaxID=150966 RepID=A0AAD3P597_NEPGR|nr:hypothetical protein Nepgr_001898 [Nepenthes gracilis]